MFCASSVWTSCDTSDFEHQGRLGAVILTGLRLTALQKLVGTMRLEKFYVQLYTPERLSCIKRLRCSYPKRERNEEEPQRVVLLLCRSLARFGGSFYGTMTGFSEIRSPSLTTG